MAESSAACWNLAAPLARLHVGPLTATLDLTQPQRGLHGLQLNGAALNGTSVLGVELSLASIEELSLPETYVRGGDLVAVYSATAARPWRVQTYWRIIAAAVPDAVVVELQTSINTGLLDARPAVDVVARLSAAKSLTDGNDPIGFALGSSNFEYWQAAHPDDPCATRLQSTPDGVQLTQRLFDRFLEKGVILRSRIRGVFAPHGTSIDAVMHEFAAAPLPLTT